jgi:hypothetical protein
MARWYASFDGSSVSVRDAIATDGCYQRVEISNGSTLKSALISTRAALSAAAYAVINAGNQDGTLGIVVPADVVTRAGGKYSWSNLYQNVGAEWPSDPRVRPTAQILSTDPASSAVSPTDAGELDPDTPYTDAVTALENCFPAMTGGGPRARIGLNPYRTLASIFHDHALTYLAWDDFTPGAVIGLDADSIGGATDLQVIIYWSGYQFPNDQNQNGRLEIYARLDRIEDGGTTNYEFSDTNIVPPQPPSALEVLWNVGSVGSPVANGSYSLVVQVRVKDAVINTHLGELASISIPQPPPEPQTPFVTIGV